MARCRGWELEGEGTDDWAGVDRGEDGDEGKVWTVRTFEKNWARFMRFIG